MQTSDLDFLPAYDMAISNDKFNRLQDRVTEISDRLAKVESGASGTPVDQNSGWKFWLPFVGLAVTVLGIVVPVLLHFDNKLETIRKDLQAATTRIDKNEGAIKALADQGPSQTQKLILDLLSAAQSSKEPVFAAKATKAATSLISTLQQEGRPAKPDFFASSIQVLNKIDSKVGIHALNTKLALANYRSALESPAHPIANPKPLPNTLTPDELKRLMATLPQQPTFESFVPSGTEMIAIVGIPPSKRTFAISRAFDHITLVAARGGSQILDGIHWHDVIFVGAHIVYLGGDLDLQNVQFVNCTFDIPSKQPTTRVNQFLDYAALEQSSLTLTAQG